MVVTFHAEITQLRYSMLYLEPVIQKIEYLCFNKICLYHRKKGPGCVSTMVSIESITIERFWDRLQGTPEIL